MSEAGRPLRSQPRVISTDYTPVDCGLHSEYERLVMQGRECTLGWCDAAGKTYRQRVTPTDIFTRDREEYLQVIDAGGVTRNIRLDRIRHCTPA